MSTSTPLGVPVRVAPFRSRAQYQAVLAGTVVAKTQRFVLHGLASAAAQQVFTSAVTFSHQPASDGAAPSPALAWVGVLVPKRWARRAVTRNAIRRQVQALAPQTHVWRPGCAYVVRLRSAFSPAEFPSAVSEPLKRAVRSELGQLFARAGAAPLT